MNPIKKKKLEDQVALMKINDLPLGVYIVADDGEYIGENKKLKRILRLNESEPITIYSTDLFKDKEQRKEILEKAKALNGNQWVENELLHLNNQGDFWVKDYFKPIKDVDTGELLGYAGFIIDYTEEYKNKQLIENIPLGTYAVDKNDKIVKVNSALCNMLGYSSNELVGENVNIVYPNKHDDYNIKQEIIEKGNINEKIFELAKKNGESIYAKLSAIALFSETSEYLGREGIIRDVNTEWRYNTLLEYEPVGFYMVKEEKGISVVNHCNLQFAKIFGYDSTSEIIGSRALDFFSDGDEYQKYLDAIKQKDNIDQPLVAYIFNGRKKCNDLFKVEISSRLIHDQDNKIIGRVGVIIDKTEAIANSEKILELTADIGRVLHIYTSTLLFLKLSTESILQGFAETIKSKVKNIDAEELNNLSIFPLNEFKGGLKEVIEHLVKIEKNPDKEILLRNCSRLFEVAENIANIQESGFKIPILRDTAVEVLTLLGGGSANILNSSIKEILQKTSNEILKLCSCISLFGMQNSIAEMHYQVHSLREYVTSGIREPENAKTISAYSLISESIKNHDEFANQSGVEIRRDKENSFCNVEVVERDMVRAISNIIHNAIKYSWGKRENKPFIRIFTTRKEGMLYINIENRGVPIRKEEIESGLIFQIGYRGTYSGDRGRMGTGIGLSDARNVVLEHKGVIMVESIPQFVNEYAYNQPFITTVAIGLPIKSK
ncbi:MAG: PAS domain-containing sensor histidine kinase [Bacteroidales bacterium]|nr:PAS domain-containing sensor histidine kinase [Bacteroidales bacterium]